MNENGQFLLYDALLSLILIFMVIIAMHYILNQEDEFIPDSNEALDRLNLLSSYSYNDENILLKLEENDSSSYEIVKEVLSDKDYILYDNTINKTVLSKYSNDYKNSVSAKKVIGEHEFILTFYS